jgi:signal transduction histidine kinase
VVREPTIVAAAPRMAAGAGALVAGVGIAVVSGWAFDVDTLKTIYGITMKTNAAISFACCGLALLLLARQWSVGVVTALASIAAAIGALTLSQHLVGWDLGIDQRLFTEAPGAAATVSPNRMGPHAATSFTLAGSALLLLWHNTPRSVRTAQALAFIGAGFALVAITGYGYGAVELYGIARYTGIAAHTALTLFVLHAGILMVRADRGAMALVIDKGDAGTVLRRLAVPVVTLPLLLGYLFIKGREAQVFDRGLGASLFAVATIAILLAVLWRTAAVIQVSERSRREAFEAAQRASHLKDQFIAVLSHELRTPLNVMLGRMQLLENERDSDTRIRAARVIVRNGQLLARLVEDLLDLSRATAGLFEIAPSTVDVNAIVQAALAAVSDDATKRGVRLSVSLSSAVGTISADALRMQQVLINLLSNAIKFTPAGGSVSVTTFRNARTATLTISDTGIGFDREFEQYLFEPFRQADQSARREHGGLGLGLSIARHLVRLHGGTITGASEGVGRGATFTIELPAPLVADALHVSDDSRRTQAPHQTGAAAVT